MHVAPALCRDGAHAVEGPPGRVLAEACLTPVGLVGGRQVCDVGVQRHVDGGGHVVEGKPAKCPYFIGHLRPALDDGAIHGEMHRYVAFPTLVPPAVDLVELHLIGLHEGIGHRRNDLFAFFVGHGQGFAHVVWRAFIIVAEEAHHLFNSHEGVGFDGEGVVFRVGVQVQGGGEQVEDTPFAATAGYHGAGGWCVGVGELEGGLAVPPAHLLGQAVHVVGGHEVVFVFEVYLPDGGGVGVDGHMVVGHALRGPDGTHLVLAGTEDLEVPDFVLVRDGEAFAGIDPAVLFEQFTGGADGVACGGAALQQQHTEALAVDESLVGLEFCASPEGRFADS